VVAVARTFEAAAEAVAEATPGVNDLDLDLKRGMRRRTRLAIIAPGGMPPEHVRPREKIAIIAKTKATLRRSAGRNEKTRKNRSRTAVSDATSRNEDDACRRQAWR